MRKTGTCPGGFKSVPQPYTCPPDKGVAKLAVMKINMLSISDSTNSPMIAGLNNLPELNAAKPPTTKRIAVTRKYNPLGTE